MAIKYFCDLCNNEVDFPAQLSPFKLESIDTDLVREFNRYDYNKWQPGFNHDICVRCRIENSKVKEG